jgi:hypothetical protein
MKQNLKEEFEKLIKQAYDAGHLAACWEDGGWPSNDNYNKSEDDLSLAVQHFLEKYND